MELTKADKEALAKMPDGWFEATNLSCQITRPWYRCDRLHKAGALEFRVVGQFPDLLAEYRKTSGLLTSDARYTPILPIPDVALVDNAEQRTPLVLVLDSSGSMEGAPIDQLNKGLQLLEKELKGDAIAAKRVRVLIVQLGGKDEARIVANWRDAMDFEAPKLVANGTTPTGQAVDLALKNIEDEKQRFKQAGVAYTRPWMFLMSDGAPTDLWKNAAERCCDAETSNKVAIFPIAVGEEADTKTLGQFSSKGLAAVKQLDGLRFRELFLWLSASMKVVSHSAPGGKVQLPPIDTWTQGST